LLWLILAVVQMPMGTAILTGYADDVKPFQTNEFGYCGLILRNKSMSQFCA